MPRSPELRIAVALGLMALLPALTLGAIENPPTTPVPAAPSSQESEIAPGSSVDPGPSSGPSQGAGRCASCARLGPGGEGRPTTGGGRGCRMMADRVDEAEAVRPRGRGMGGAPRNGTGGRHALMQGAMTLVHGYRDVIERHVEEIDAGVVTVTRSPSSPEAAAAIERHVREMQALLESGGRIRGWDPLFREIFDHYDRIEMTVESLPDGVRVTETSDDPEVAKLIQAHARKVDEFLARGPAAVHEETPLPDDYDPAG